MKKQTLNMDTLDNRGDEVMVIDTFQGNQVEITLGQVIEMITSMIDNRSEYDSDCRRYMEEIIDRLQSNYDYCVGDYKA